MKILLVDDDIQLTQLISRQLKQSNYVVDVAGDGEYAIDLIHANSYSLVILDVILPCLSGIEVCQKIRSLGSDTPILMLTGQDEICDRISGLDAGADDYLVKPFELDELTARVRALLRRNSGPSTPLLRHGEMVFDPAGQSLAYKGKPFLLRPKELAILELMLRYPTQIFSADSLLEKLWNLADCPGIATVKVHIRSLRKQLDAIGACALIETLYGRGYRLNPTFLTKSSAAQPQPVTQDAISQPLIMTHPAMSWQSSSSSQEIVAQTWESMQMVSWQRLMRLEAVVRSLSDQVLNSAAATLTKSQRSQRISDIELEWESLFKDARDLAHQLKGSLGTFGFKEASLKAKQLEKCFAPLSNDYVATVQSSIPLIQALHQLLRQRITQKNLLEAVLSTNQSWFQGADTKVLVISRDHIWQQRLRGNYGRLPFSLSFCSPLSLDDSFLQPSPSAIILDLSTDEYVTDLSLLQAIASNYGESLPVLAITNPGDKDDTPTILEKGATVCIPKSWSAQTLLSVITEYLVPQPQEVIA